MNRVSWLSSLRGLMVLLVFFSHLYELSINLDLMFVLGRIGVAGFFMMSGYLAVTSLERRSVKQYAFNRFLRLYPIYWLLLTMFVLISQKNYTFVEWLANMTLFQEFAGFESILGASWMLPIMVVFFAALMVCKKNTDQRIGLFFWILCAGALLMGVLRMATGKSFPTAFCLLQLVGLLGWTYRKNGMMSREMHVRMMVFELVIVAAAYMSYGDKAVFYFMAYNIGIAMFWLFSQFDLHCGALDRLGTIGFTFFLGAGIPMAILGRFMDVSSINVFVEVLIKFVLALAMSWIVSKYVETPMLKWGKTKENTIS